MFIYMLWQFLGLVLAAVHAWYFLKIRRRQQLAGTALLLKIYIPGSFLVISPKNKAFFVASGYIIYIYRHQFNASAIIMYWHSTHLHTDRYCRADFYLFRKSFLPVFQ
jgi:hypothetical protein